MLIAHIADIHYRSLSRHTEYKIVFDQFFKELVEKNVDYVFVAGDIFHTKTSGISPEFIDQISWWIKGLASSVKSVHIILGNHDGNLINITRQDAITPIVSALSIPNVHLYKKSGVYQFEKGFNWCHFGIFDKNWDSVSPVKGDINIACYHGGVIGADSETGWGIGHGLDVTFFKKYQFTFLGDIHKTQHLGTRETKNGNRPWISYPGSVIQQNYGESTNHGYLLWDIKNANDYDVEFCELPNPKPFVTVDWKGTIEETLEEFLKYPDESRFRIRSKVKLAHQDVKDLTARAIDVKKATEVTFKVDYLSNKTSQLKENSEKKEELSGSNLHKIATLIKLMKEYYTDTKISKGNWSEITEIVREYINSSDIDNSVIRGVKWSPKLLSFDNTYGYGLGNSIDFEKMNGIVGIFGDNRVGKSSIIGTLLWSLHNSSDRGRIKNYHLINTRKNYCKTTLVFSCNGKDYVIERQAEKNESKYSSDASITTLNFFSVKDNGDLELKNGIQRTDTEKNIRRLVGSFEDFLLMSVATQDDVSKFVKHGSTHRARILAKFLDLDVISTMHEMAKVNAQDIRSKMSVVKFRDWDLIVKEKIKRKKSLISNLSEIDSTLILKRTELDDLRVKFSSSSGETYVSVDDIKKQESRVSSLKKKIEKSEFLIDSCKQSIISLDKKIETIQGAKEKYDMRSMKSTFADCKKIDEKLFPLGQKLKDEKSLYNRQIDSIKLLKLVPCGDNYPMCKFIKNSHKDKLKIERQVEKIEKLTLKINEYEKKLRALKYEDLSSNIAKLEKIFFAETTLSKENAWKKKEKEMLELSTKNERVELVEAESLLTRLKKSSEKDSSSMLDLFKEEIDCISKEINNLDKKKTVTSVEIGRIDEEIKTCQTDKKFYEEHKKNLRLYELITNSFSKKGIPNRIIVKSLPLINEEIEKVLQGVVDFTVELEIDEDGNDLEVYINYGDSRRIAELGSGMEKMISSIAIRVALCNVSSLPKSDILVIDEGFGSLDESSIEASNRLLIGLKKYFKSIIIISHIDAVKDVTDSIIEIIKNEKDSYVSY